jgi:acetyl-CoA acetyltransferase
MHFAAVAVSTFAEGHMPALLPFLLLSSHIVLVADPIPKLDTGPSCKSAGAAAVMGGNHGTRTAAACEQDEKDAYTKLEQVWGTFNGAEQARCVRLSTLGGSPSYVELLTCLEMAKAAKQLPASDRMGDDSRVDKN